MAFTLAPELETKKEEGNSGHLHSRGPQIIRVKLTHPIYQAVIDTISHHHTPLPNLHKKTRGEGKFIDVYTCQN